MDLFTLAVPLRTTAFWNSMSRLAAVFWKDSLGATMNFPLVRGWLLRVPS